MKTFNSTDVSNRPGQVFKAAVEDGAVKINHGSYKDTMFELRARPRGKAHCPHCHGGYIKDDGHEPGCPNMEEK